MLGKLVKNFITHQVGVVVKEDKDTVTIMVLGTEGDQYTTEYEKDRINTESCPWDYISDSVA